MLLINKVQLYNLEKTSKNVDTIENVKTNFEFFGNDYSSVVCFIHSQSPLSESKDYNLLTKVFENLKWNTNNFLTINTNTCKSSDFDFILRKFKIKTLFIFGDNEFVQSLPFQIANNSSTQYKNIKIFKTIALQEIANTSDKNYKIEIWEAIKSFFSKSI